MDNRGDSTITFNKEGICNYCEYAMSRKDSVYLPGEKGEPYLNALIKKLREQGKSAKYDCLMGFSGGLDSTYLAFLGNKWGLRILGVHIDDGFDSDAAKHNIERLKTLKNIEIRTETVNREQYYDLTKSFLLAGVPNIAIPQDNILLARLFQIAKSEGIRYFLSGANFSLESILQRGNTHNAADNVHIKAIHKQFGKMDISELPLISLYENYVKYKYQYRTEKVRPLDYVDYNRSNAIRTLEEEIGFRYYGGKHYESVFTKFVQVYYLPKKFNVDKRKSHLSSMIISGQITREEALKELKESLYEEQEMEKEIRYICGLLLLPGNEFDRIMQAPPKKHTDYKTSTLSRMGKIARKFRKILSD